MNEKMWRFVGNNYATETGLDTADMETFKKDPISSLAREICQNSLDARLDTSKPVTVEFSNFIDLPMIVPFSSISVASCLFFPMSMPIIIICILPHF